MDPDSLEIVQDRLYWAALAAPPEHDESRYYFSIDDVLVYEPFSQDFGPLSLAHTVRYCHHLQNCLRSHQVVVHYTSTDPRKRANAAYLICAYQILCLRKSAEEAYSPFRRIDPFIGFCDATICPCDFECTILDCITGLEYAMRLGWFDWNQFDLTSYEYYERVEQGDLTWIIPGRFLAFASPGNSSPFPNISGFLKTPAEVADTLKEANVPTVIRLSKKDYDREEFIRRGIRHVDLFFTDGSCPSDTIISNFFEIAEKDSRAIAIHCKAGLGRTGTLIGLYCMKHYFFPARAFIGWNRICRPGSILGAQQQFLCSMEAEMFQAGVEIRQGDVVMRPPSMTDGEREAYENAQDVGQGDRLCAARGARCVSRMSSTSKGSEQNERRFRAVQSGTKKVQSGTSKKKTSMKP